MSGSVARECISSSTSMQEIIGIRQLEPVCLKMFQHKLKAEDSEIKCQLLAFLELKKISQLPLFNRVWSLKWERCVQTDTEYHD